MDRTIDVVELEANFDQLVEEAASGTAIVITRDGVAVAKLVAVNAHGERAMGFLKGHIPDSFFEPLPEEESAAWEGMSEADKPVDDA